MIRRDYILRMIEEFVQALARIRSLKTRERWQETAATLDEEFHRLIGAGTQAVAQFTETELLARLIEGEPTAAVREKTLMLATLLKEAGDLATTRDCSEEGTRCYLKGLHLLLGILDRGDAFECPEFVPNVEVFASALRDSAVPVGTLAMLMQHYERIGEFAKAENALFGMLDAEPGNAAILDFGTLFYQRLQGQSDAALAAGNLPRAELEAGLADLRGRKTSLSSKPR